MREQTFHGGFQHQFSRSVCDQHDHPGIKFDHHLAARSAWGPAVIGYHRTGGKLAFPFRNCFENGNSFSTNAGWVGGIFNINPGKYLSRNPSG